jgi:hypothetical protein
MMEKNTNCPVLLFGGLMTKITTENGDLNQEKIKSRTFKRHFEH